MSLFTKILKIKKLLTNRRRHQISHYLINIFALNRVSDMAEGICNLSIIPVRAEPSGKSTMVNQLLFGDRVSILEEFTSWYKIISLHDNYEGWCEKNQIDLTQHGNSDTPISIVQSPTATFVSPTDKKILLFGSSIQQSGESYILAGSEYKLTDGKVDAPLLPSGENIVEAARSLLESPYLWGGRSPFGIDCSGLIQVVFKSVGINLPRDAWQQAEAEGEYIDLMYESIEGDIAFFDNDEGRIIHTGILTGLGEIIHASGKVRIDPVDHFGIFNKELRAYTHKMRVIKRFHQ